MGDFLLQWVKKSGEADEESCDTMETVQNEIGSLIANGATEISLWERVPFEVKTRIVLPRRKRSSSAGPQEGQPPSDPSVVPAGEKSRDVPEKCIAGCGTKGSARNQWFCASCAEDFTVQERRMHLEQWKKARRPAAGPSENKVHP